MTADPLDVNSREAALATLLNRHKDGLLVALGDDGFRVSMPASADLARYRTVDVPADRATMVDLVVPADAMTVVTTWERAHQKGAAIGTVRALTDPERPVMLAIMDARHRYGVWLGVLGDMDDEPAEWTAERLDASLLVPLRPRTATIHKDMHAMIVAVDDRVSRMLGWSPEQMTGVRSLEFVHPDDHERAVVNWMEMLSHQQAKRVRLRHRCQDGSWLWVELENIFHAADDPDDIVVETQLSDISDEMAAHEAVHQREQLFRRLAESLPSGLLQISRDRSIVYANNRLAEILGVHAATTLADQLARIVDDDRSKLEEALDAALIAGVDSEMEVEIRLSTTGDPRICTVALVALTDQEGASGAIISVHDVTDSARMREELRIRATFDSLTGCHNRASIMASLEHALDWDGGQTAVIYVDLDKFKPVNDKLGHAAGDELLIHVAQCLTGLLRNDDQVGRIGGDEFLVVCRRLDASSQAIAIAERIRDVLHKPVRLSAGTITPAASIGVAMASHGDTTEEIVARADAAMYESKRYGQGHAVLSGVAS